MIYRRHVIYLTTLYLLFPAFTTHVSGNTQLLGTRSETFNSKKCVLSSKRSTRTGLHNTIGDLKGRFLFVLLKHSIPCDLLTEYA